MRMLEAPECVKGSRRCVGVALCTMTTALIVLRLIGLGFVLVGCRASFKGGKPLPRDTWNGEERSKAQDESTLANRRAVQWTSIGTVLALAAELFAAIVGS